MNYKTFTICRISAGFKIKEQHFFSIFLCYLCNYKKGSFNDEYLNEYSGIIILFDFFIKTFDIRKAIKSVTRVIKVFFLS